MAMMKLVMDTPITRTYESVDERNSMKTWIVFDVPNIAYRAYYGYGPKSQHGMKRGTLFGMLRTILEMKDRFGSLHFAFAFDEGAPFRQEISRSYKDSRRKREAEMSAEDRARLFEHRQQVAFLKKEVLPSIGYKNIFFKDGYEADDVIASLVQSLRRDDVIIVSGDHDFYQLLSAGRVFVWQPIKNKLYSQELFTEEYGGLHPSDWITVKAIAGDASDGIPGVPKVGEITAIKYLLNKLAPESKACQKIMDNKALWKANIDLIRLPYPGVGAFRLSDDTVMERDWRRVCEDIGMMSVMKEAFVSKPKSVKWYE